MKLTNKQLRQIIKEELERALGEEHQDDLMDELFPKEITESMFIFGGALGYFIAFLWGYMSWPGIDFPSKMSIQRPFEVSLNRFLNTVPDHVKERIGKAQDELEEEEVAILLTAFEEDKELTALTKKYMDLATRLEKEKHTSDHQGYMRMYKQRRELGREINDKLQALAQRRW